MTILYIVKIIIYWRGLSVRSYSLNSEKAVLFGDFGDSEVGWDEGNRAGLTGMMKAVDDKVL